MPSRLRRLPGRAGIVALAVYSAIGCSGGKRDARDLGIAVALNPQRAGMQTIYNGVELAVEHLNAQRGRGVAASFRMVKGQPDVSDPVKIAGTFRDDAAVVGVVGHPESGTTLAAVDEYADTRNDGRNAVVAITPTGTSPAISGANRWLFRICPSDAQSSAAVARFLLDSMNARRASVIYRNDSYGKDWAKSFAETYRASGGTVVQRDPYLQGATPWDAYARYIRQLAPDAVLFPGNAEDGLLALRALRAAGVSTPFIGGDAASALEDNATEFPDVRYTAFFLARRAVSAEARAFVAAYSTRYRAAPDQRAALAYDAAMLIGRAALEVGRDRAKIRDHIERVRGSRAVQGVAGPIDFDEQHDAINKVVVIARVGR